MRLNIRVKMFLILLLSNIAIIAAMYGLILVSFETGFNTYIEDIEEQQLERLSIRLANLYQVDQSFTLLKHDKSVVKILEGLFLFGVEASPEYAVELIEDNDTPLFVVLDKQKNIIIGHLSENNDTLLLPIQIDGNVIGWLGFSDIEEDDIFEEESFVETQSQEYLIIAFCTVLGSALFAMGATYYFVKPIKALTKGTQDLASGKYDTRLIVQSNDEVGDLSFNFNKLANTLEENVRTRQKWVENISHELKTPLALLAGEVEAIQDGVRPLTTTTIDLLGNDIEHLSVLINDLDELWQTETGAMVFKKKETSLIKIVQHSIEKTIKQFEVKNISLDFRNESEDDFLMDIDPKRFLQLFDNILQNSLRYTNSGGKVIVSLSKSTEYRIIQIQDTAPGVENSDLPFLFDRLFRVESSRNRAYGGAGIGLAVCKNIVNGHGGIINAKCSSMGGLNIQIMFSLQT